MAQARNGRSGEELVGEDVRVLHQLGYAQELLRTMGGFSNFAISFSIISVLTGAVIPAPGSLRVPGRRRSRDRHRHHDKHDLALPRLRHSVLSGAGRAARVAHGGGLGLGRYSRPIAIVALLWTAFISILFVWPTSGNPIPWYAMLIFVALLAIYYVAWALRRFFGPRPLDEDELLALERRIEGPAPGAAPS